MMSYNEWKPSDLNLRSHLHGLFNRSTQSIDLHAFASFLVSSHSHSQQNSNFRSQSQYRCPRHQPIYCSCPHQGICKSHESDILNHRVAVQQITDGMGQHHALPQFDVCLIWTKNENIIKSYKEPIYYYRFMISQP